MQFREKWETKYPTEILKLYKSQFWNIISSVAYKLYHNRTMYLHGIFICLTFIVALASSAVVKAYTDDMVALVQVICFYLSCYRNIIIHFWYAFNIRVYKIYCQLINITAISSKENYGNSWRQSYFKNVS